MVGGGLQNCRIDGTTGGFVGALKFDGNDLKEADEVNALSQVLRPLIGAEFKGLTVTVESY